MRFPLTSIVLNKGPQYAVFSTRFAVMRLEQVYTLVATFGVAKISSMLRLGNVAKLLILLLFISRSPVFGFEVLISFSGLGSYVIPPDSSTTLSNAFYIASSMFSAT